MPARDGEDPPRVRSWITPKAVKGGSSAIEGRGVHAVEPIAADCFVAALTRDEYEGVMMRVNHSCQPTWAWAATCCW